MDVEQIEFLHESFCEHHWNERASEPAVGRSVVHMFSVPDESKQIQLVRALNSVIDLVIHITHFWYKKYSSHSLEDLPICLS